MKKNGNNQRPPNKTSGPRRGNPKAQRNPRNRPQNPSGPNRNSFQGRKPAGQHLWVTSSSASTLTSHLTMGNRRKQDGSGKNAPGKNGTGRPRGKFRTGENASHAHHAQRHPANRPPAGRPHPAQPIAKTDPTPQSRSVSPTHQPESKTNTFGIDPFDLFCAYHLGIGPNNQYRPSNLNEVANRFSLDTGTTRQILKEYEMDSASLLDKDFDLALAQLDIQVAPEGIDRTELARNIYEDFLSADIKKRDWKKILEEDRKENAKVFGRR